MEMSQTESLKELHANLIKYYGLKKWDYCEQAIEQLMGKWGGELDTFYQDNNIEYKILPNRVHWFIEK